MAMFSQTVKASVGRTSVYLIGAAGAAGMLSSSQYKSMKSLFDNTPGFPAGHMHGATPFEHVSTAAVPSRINHSHAQRHTKFIASTEHGPHGNKHPHPRRRPAGLGRSSSPSRLHHSRRGGEAHKRSVFPRHGVA